MKANTVYTVWFTQKITGDTPFIWDHYETEAEAKEYAEALPHSEYHETITKAWVQTT